jgi:hypothetical protein
MIFTGTKMLENKRKNRLIQNICSSGINKLLIVLFILTSISLTGINCTTADVDDIIVTDENTIIDENSVTIDEARKVAAMSIPTHSFAFSEWEGAELGDNVYIFHIPSSARCAYEFEVIKNDVQVGYIIISARKDWMPVLEGGEGEGTGSDIERTRQILIDEGYLDKNDRSQPILYYGGALSRSAQFGQKMKDENILIALSSGRLFPMPERDPVLQMDKDTANDAWEYVLSIPE